MKINNIKIIGIIVLILVTTGCKSKKNLAVKSKWLNADLATIISEHKSSVFPFETLQNRVQISVKTNKENAQAGMSMRIKNDSIIWGSIKLAGIIPLAKLRITPTQAQYYEKLGSTYFDGNLALSKKWLGFSFTFSNLENLLTAKPIFPIKDVLEYDFSNNKKFAIHYRKENIFIRLILDPITLQLKEQIIIQENTTKQLSISYPKYEEVSNKFFPKEININLIEGDKTTMLDLVYKSNEFNIPLNFPFTIPDNYKQIYLD